MSRSNPNQQALARRLIAGETRGRKPTATTNPAFLVCEKLRPHLATLMGNAGFQALMSRALALAQAKSAWLRTVHVKPDGSLETEPETPPPDPEALAESGDLLVAQLLGLLVMFIGENLTLQLLREVWPKLSLNLLNFSEGEKDEKTN